MSVKSVVARAINVLRGPLARARSPHTTTEGLLEIYGLGQARQEVVLNIRSRILSAKLTGAALAKLPHDLMRDIVTSCGWTVAATDNDLARFFVSERLTALAQESWDSIILASLADNPDGEVNRWAIVNPATPGEAIALCLGQSQINPAAAQARQADGVYRESRNIARNRCFDDGITLTKYVIKQQSTEKAVIVMAKLEELNSRLAEAVLYSLFLELEKQAEEKNLRISVAAAVKRMNLIPRDKDVSYPRYIDPLRNSIGPIIRLGYFNPGRTAAWEILNQYYPEKAVLIMAELKKVNAELVRAMVG